MLKSFGLIDNIWLNKSVNLPQKFAEKYIIHDLYSGNPPFKDEIKKWELGHNNSTGRYPYVIEIIDEYERKNHNSVYQGLKSLIALLRLLKFNRIYLAHIV